MNNADSGIYDQHVATREVEPGFWQIDLGFQGRAGVIAAYLIAGDGQLSADRDGPQFLPPKFDGGYRSDRSRHLKS